MIKHHSLSHSDQTPDIVVQQYEEISGRSAAEPYPTTPTNPFTPSFPTTVKQEAASANVGPFSSPPHPHTTPLATSTPTRDFTPLDLSAESSDGHCSDRESVSRDSALHKEEKMEVDVVKAEEGVGGAATVAKKVFKCSHCPFVTDVSNAAYRKHCKGE